MRVAGVAGRTVGITVRFADFTTITRSRTMPEATDVTQEIYRGRGPALRRTRPAARQAAAGRGPGRGAGAAHHACSDSGVLGERDRGWSDADRAVDRATLRFGGSAVRPASLIDREERHYGDHGIGATTRWGSTGPVARTHQD